MSVWSSAAIRKALAREKKTGRRESIPGRTRMVTNPMRRKYSYRQVHDFDPGLKQLDPKAGPLTQLLWAMESKEAEDFKLAWFEERLYPILHLKYFGELLETDPGGGIWKRHIGCKGRRVSSARLHRVAMGILKVLNREGLR